MRLSGQFQASFFFTKKILSAQKHVTSKNKLTKQKQANTQQRRQQIFARTKASKRVLFCAQILFINKKLILWLEIVLIISFKILLMCTRFNLPIEIFLYALIFICNHLRESLLFYENIFESFLSATIFLNLFFFMIICVNLSF